MNKALFCLNFIIITTQLNGMLTEKLPQELNKKILLLAPLYVASLKETSLTMDHCSQVCWSWNRFVNDKDHTLTWIKALSAKHNLSDMDVTKQLCTAGAFNRYTLQQASSVACWGEIIQNLNLLHTGGLDLNFTYGKTIVTSLIRLAPGHSFGYNKIAQWFIDMGADINIRRKSDGQDALMIALADENGCVIPKMINHSTLQPNAQDNAGNTYLLCALEQYNKWQYLDKVIDTIKQLLEKGADPELGNNDGLTPLKEAESMNNLTLINLFKDAIIKKHNAQRP